MTAARNARGDRRRLALAVLVALGLGVGYALAPYATGLFGATILYVMAAPVHRALARRLPAGWAALLVILAVLLLILVPTLWLVSVAVGETPGILADLGNGNALARLQAIRIGPLAIGGQLAALGGQLLSWASRQAVSVFGSATRGTLNLVIALTGLYYLLLEPDTLWERTKALLPFSDATAERLRLRFHSITESMLLGTALTAVLQGTVIGLAFWGLHIHNALFWGAVTALASIVPVVGSALVWLPAAGIMALGGRYGAAIALLAIGGIVAANIDNVARPLIYRRVSNLHPMITIVGAFAGVTVMGFAGVLIGPLAISYFFELVTAYREEYGAAAASATPAAPAAAPVAAGRADPPAPAPLEPTIS